MVQVDPSRGETVVTSEAPATTSNTAEAPRSADRQAATQERSPLWLKAGPAIFLLLWSFGFPVAKIGIRHADPLMILTLRYGLVLIVLAPLIVWFRPRLPARRIDWLHLAVVGFLIQTLYFGLCYTAFTFGMSAGTMALIVSLQPVVVALAAPAMVGEVIGLKRWLGFGLGLAGAVIVILCRSTVEVTSATGLILTIVGLFGMSGAALYEKRFGVTQHPLVANAVQYGVGFITTLPFAFLFGSTRVDWNGEFIAVMAYLVIGNSLIAITLMLAMIRHGEASRVAALFFLVPPLAALLSWPMIGETMPAAAWIGMAVAAIGVALASKRAGKKA
jgi:drug/metabolite transporter (DMT)-like permease